MKRIGQGGFAKAWLVESSEGNQAVAWQHLRITARSLQRPTEFFFGASCQLHFTTIVKDANNFPTLS